MTAGPNTPPPAGPLFERPPPPAPMRRGFDAEEHIVNGSTDVTRAAVESPSGEVHVKPATITAVVESAIAGVGLLPKSREAAIARTKLEEAVMWLAKVPS